MACGTCRRGNESWDKSCNALILLHPRSSPRRVTLSKTKIPGEVAGGAFIAPQMIPHPRPETALEGNAGTFQHSHECSQRCAWSSVCRTLCRWRVRSSPGIRGRCKVSKQCHLSHLHVEGHASQYAVPAVLLKVPLAHALQLPGEAAARPLWNSPAAQLKLHAQQYRHPSHRDKSFCRMACSCANPCPRRSGRVTGLPQCSTFFFVKLACFARMAQTCANLSWCLPFGMPHALRPSAA